MNQQSALTNFSSLEAVEDDDLEGIGRAAAQGFAVQGGTTDQFLVFLDRTGAETVAETVRRYPGVAVNRGHLLVIRNAAMQEWIRIKSAPQASGGTH